MSPNINLSPNNLSIFLRENYICFCYVILTIITKQKFHFTSSLNLNFKMQVKAILFFILLNIESVSSKNVTDVKFLLSFLSFRSFNLPWNQILFYIILSHNFLSLYLNDKKYLIFITSIYPLIKIYYNKPKTILFFNNFTLNLYHT